MNLKTIAKFAEEKGTTRTRIYQLITRGVLVPTIIDDVQFINIDKYGDFDVKARVKREESIIKLQKDVYRLSKDILNLKRVVFGNSETIMEPSENH